MKIRSERDKRTYLIIALCAIVVIMGVGYAAFSSMLTINGTANISNSWCVGFDNTKTNDLQITKGLSTGTTPTGSMSYSGTACGTNLVPTSSLVAHFYQPGDKIEYTLTITNKSTVTAAIKSILVDNESVTSDTTKKKDNITYIIEMPEDTTLAPNASTTMKVIAKFQNETDVTGAYSGETKTIEVKINAEQDDGNGGFTPTPATYTGTIYRWSTTALANKNSTDASNTTYTIAHLTEGTDYVNNASLLNKTYYLKHDIVDDEIINSYVCFVYNNAEHCMKGADGGASFAANTQMIQEYQTFYSLNNVSSPSSSNPGCYFDSSRSSCNGGGFTNVGAGSGGNVYVYGSSSETCRVYIDGYSDCYQW
ncbi:MAG: hypothetical protein IKF82_03820 [Bacilli bacterium]|nr:hypothetical protein [Bacilli bacterium]